MNALRKKCNDNKRHSSEDSLDQYDEIIKDDKNISEEFQKREYIRDIIVRLPEKLKSVIMLKVYSDMSFDEIARTLNISSRQARNRLEQAYSKLKVYLEKDKLKG